MITTPKSIEEVDEYLKEAHESIAKMRTQLDQDDGHDPGWRRRCESAVNFKENECNRLNNIREGMLKQIARDKVMEVESRKREIKFANEQLRLQLEISNVEAKKIRTAQHTEQVKLKQIKVTHENREDVIWQQVFKDIVKEELGLDTLTKLIKLTNTRIQNNE